MKYQKDVLDLFSPKFYYKQTRNHTHKCEWDKELGSIADVMITNYRS